MPTILLLLLAQWTQPYPGPPSAGAHRRVCPSGANGITGPSAINAAPWTNDAGSAVTANTSTTPSGAGADRVTNTGATRRSTYQQATIVSSATFTLSALASAQLGAATASIWPICGAGTVSACSCTTDTGVACTTTISSDRCYVDTAAPVGGWVRLRATVTCSSASANPYGAVAAQLTKSIDFAEVKLEAGPKATHFCQPNG